MTVTGVRRRETKVHIFSKGGGWVLVAGDDAETAPDAGEAFDDLGHALDAATLGDGPVHVIVHERGTD
jgi:hypothetical protein